MEARRTRRGHPGTTVLLLVLAMQPLPALASSSALVRAVENALVYTTNSLCFERYCINPIFPGMRKYGRSVLAANENRTWRCVRHHDEAWRGAGFCQQAVSEYEFALPEPEGDQTEKELAHQQARKALEAYVAHITGMGRDFWSVEAPWLQDKCIQAVWRMSCYTYFPRCNRGAEDVYLRPCASTCQSYVSSCQVTCCDEGVRCVFDHRKQLPDGTTESEEGYINHAGPSSLCTGAAARPGAPRLLGLPTLLAALAGLAASAAVAAPSRHAA